MERNRMIPKSFLARDHDSSPHTISPPLDGLFLLLSVSSATATGTKVGQEEKGYLSLFAFRIHSVDSLVNRNALVSPPLQKCVIMSSFTISSFRSMQREEVKIAGRKICRRRNRILIRKLKVNLEKKKLTSMDTIMNSLKHLIWKFKR